MFSNVTEVGKESEVKKVQSSLTNSSVYSLMLFAQNISIQFLYLFMWCVPNTERLVLEIGDYVKNALFTLKR